MDLAETHKASMPTLRNKALLRFPRTGAQSSSEKGILSEFTRRTLDPGARELNCIRTNKVPPSFKDSEVRPGNYYEKSQSN